MTPQVVVETAPVREPSVEVEHSLISVPCEPLVMGQPAGTVRWKPDGTAIFFGFSSPVENFKYYELRLVEILGVAADGSRMWRVGQVGQRWGVAASFDISPTGEHIVYPTCQFPALSRIDRKYAGKYFDLARTTILGSTRQRLIATSRGISEHNPAWSPDGTHIAFLVGKRDIATLGVMRADGTNLRWPIDVGSPVNIVATQPPAWSPDGRWLAVAVRQFVPGIAALKLVAMPTGEEVTYLADAVSGASWSPDGERLAFAKVDGDGVALYSIAVDGSDARRLTSITDWHLQLDGYGNHVNFLSDPTHAWVDTVAWSPDGSKILYTCGLNICVVDVDGNVVGRSPPHSRTLGLRAAWSADSTRIAVNERFGSGGFDSRLYIMAPDGEIQRILVVTGWGGKPQAIGPRRAEGPVDVTGCAGGTVVPDPAANSGLVGDCETLLRLQGSLAGGAPLPWAGKRPLTTWEGVVVAGSPARVTAISLSEDVLLRGIIPPELGQLTHLQVLELNRHNLGGTIPPELGQLTNLQVLRLDRNLLSGAIPAELGEMTGLTGLWLDNNHLQGPVPAELSRLANLEVLDLSENILTGEIPLELGQLANLKRLFLHDNRLTGEIPLELGQLANLKRLFLHDNRLTGEIPLELGQLANLKRLFLHDNRLTGEIPAELSRLANLETLDLSENILTGPIPPELGQLANLVALDLGFNELTGAIPPELGQLANLHNADLSGNELTGAIPPELGQLANLEYLELDGNPFTGCIPPAIYELGGTTLVDLPVCDKK